MRVVPKEIEPPLIKKLRTGQAYVVARTGHGNYSAKLVFAPITKGRVRIGIISGVDGKDRETSVAFNARGVLKGLARTAKDFVVRRYF